MKNSTFSVVALGGNAQHATGILTPGDSNQSSLIKLIQSDATFSRDTPPVPISYTVHFLKDNELATIGFTTTYVENECKEYPEITINFKNEGAYEGRFTLYWKQYDKVKKEIVERDWHDTFSAGSGGTMHFPGDVSKIRIIGEGHSGFAWKKVFDLMIPPNPVNKTYILRHTIFDPGWDIR